MAPAAHSTDDFCDLTASAPKHKWMGGHWCTKGVNGMTAASNVTAATSPSLPTTTTQVISALVASADFIHYLC